MMMATCVRKFVLTAHVSFSVGWLGAVAAYLAPAFVGLTSHDGEMARAAYLTMNLIVQSIILPLSLASLLTGLVLSLGSEWGLFRYYWISIKFFLTITAVTILVLHMPTVSAMSRTVAEMTLSSVSFAALRVQLLIHAAGGLLVLFATTTLSVYKPWAKTPYGRRKQRGRLSAQRQRNQS
jgi:hypothetical protein